MKNPLKKKPEPKAEIVPDERAIEKAITIRLLQTEEETAGEFREEATATGVESTPLAPWTVDRLLTILYDPTEEQLPIVGFTSLREFPLHVAARTQDRITREGSARRKSVAQTFFEEHDRCSLSRNGFGRKAIVTTHQRMMEAQAESSGSEMKW